MTDQHPEQPASAGSAWPEFSYDQAPGSEPTTPVASGSPYQTPSAQPYQPPAATTPLPYAEPDLASQVGNYTQPSVPQTSYEPYTPGVASVTPYAYQPTVLPEHPSATTAMVLGLLSILVFSPLGPFAWRTAAKARAEIAAFPGRWSSSTSLTVGYVTGIIGTIFFALGAAAIIGLVIFVAIGAAIAANG